MIGPKKLSTIRQELRQAVAATGDDPIRWLEERMKSPGGQGPAVGGPGEVLLTLSRLLAGTGRGEKRKAGIGTRKRQARTRIRRPS